VEWRGIIGLPSDFLLARFPIWNPCGGRSLSRAISFGMKRARLQAKAVEQDRDGRASQHHEREFAHALDYQPPMSGCQQKRGTSHKGEF
jgi:hypothetical protein